MKLEQILKEALSPYFRDDELNKIKKLYIEYVEKKTGEKINVEIDDGISMTKDIFRYFREGGCGIFASDFYDFLKSNYLYQNIEFTFFVDNAETEEELFSGEPDVNHVALKYGDYYIDGDGINTLNDILLNPFYVSDFAYSFDPNVEMEKIEFLIKNQTNC